MNRFLLFLCICLLLFSAGCKNKENSKVDLKANLNGESKIAVSENTNSDKSETPQKAESQEEKAVVSEKTQSESESKVSASSSKAESRSETATSKGKTTTNKTAGATSSTAQTVHKNTEVRNKKSATTTSQGYTGDTYCKDCGTKISSGKTIAVIKLEQESYELPDHTVITVNKGTDVFDYTLDLAHKNASSKYSAIENEILNLINAERKKAGVGALSWNSKIYYYTNKRAQECHICYDHTRPNGTDWYTVFTDANVILDKELGENLALTKGIGEKELAKQLVANWMNSPTHRANILDPTFKSTAIAVVSYGDEFCIEECFSS